MSTSTVPQRRAPADPSRTFFLRPLAILDFVSSNAATYAQVRAKRERAGTPIGRLDTLFAVQAFARRLTLVSNNRKEFARVPGFPIENCARVKGR